jgi:hypothetical protein
MSQSIMNSKPSLLESRQLRLAVQRRVTRLTGKPLKWVSSETSHMWGLEVERHRSMAFCKALFGRVEMEAYGSHRRTMLFADAVRMFANSVRMMPKDRQAHALHVMRSKLYELKDHGVDIIGQYF